ATPRDQAMGSTIGTDSIVPDADGIDSAVESGFSPNSSSAPSRRSGNSNALSGNEYARGSWEAEERRS
ncbi:unnamed protein product, partial [Prorocentrum cordatum]